MAASRRALLAGLALAVAHTCAAAGDTEARRALQSACFAPSALQAAPGEHIAKKGDRSFAKSLARSTPLMAAGPVPDHLRGAIRSVGLPPGRKLVALTLDLCEQSSEIAGYDGRIFDILRRENVKATLFAGGKWMRSHETRTHQLISDPLFEMANHAEAHRNLRMLNGDALQDEILGPQRAYELIRQRFSETQCAASVPEVMQSLPPRMSLFRFPYGACNAESMKAVNDAGLLAIQWDVSIGDPSPGTKPAAMLRTIKNVKPGSIIIAHANGRGWHTADALPALIADLKKRGFEFVTVSELLAAGTPVIAETCYNAKLGDTDRYDHFTGLLAARRQSGGAGWGTLEVKPEHPSAKRPAPKM